jgi:hypothetical protein
MKQITTKRLMLRKRAKSDPMDSLLHKNVWIKDSIFLPITGEQRGLNPKEDGIKYMNRICC